MEQKKWCRKEENNGEEKTERKQKGFPAEIGKPL